MLRESKIFHYKSVRRDQDCFCKLEVYDNKNGVVCIATELENNPGASITNSIEYIEEALQKEYGDHVLIEHYGEESYRSPIHAIYKDTYSLVDFCKSGLEFGLRSSHPRWSAINLGEIDHWLE